MDHRRDHVCSIVPFYILEAMSKSSDPKVRECGLKSLSCQQHVLKGRFESFQAKIAAHHQSHHATHSHGIVPPNLLQAIVDSKETSAAEKESAQKTLAVSKNMHDDRAGASASIAGQLPSAAAGAGQQTPTGFNRKVYDMKGKGDDEKEWTLNLLPGKLVRSEGGEPTGDKAADDVYDHTLKVLNFYREFFKFDPLDGKAMPVISSVHFDTNMGNAFWTDFKQQLVYGDGDGVFLYNFTDTIDVIGHEITHAVTSYTSNLTYENQSGALNEHLSDVWGVMVKQFVEQETAENADWLIGEGVLLPGVKGVALRNMKAPGTAWNDERFGKDWQPDSVAGMEELMKTHGDWINENDYGGVHFFSGIPNRAFVLTSIALGGYSWEKAGQIWWKVVSSKSISTECNFMQFADLTVDAALALYGETEAKIVRDAWNTVGVVHKI